MRNLQHCNVTHLHVLTLWRNRCYCETATTNTGGSCLSANNFETILGHYVHACTGPRSHTYHNRWKSFAGIWPCQMVRRNWKGHWNLLAHSTPAAKTISLNLPLITSDSINIQLHLEKKIHHHIQNILKRCISQSFYHNHY